MHTHKGNEIVLSNLLKLINHDYHYTEWGLYLEAFGVQFNSKLEVNWYKHHMLQLLV